MARSCSSSIEAAAGHLHRAAVRSAASRRCACRSARTSGDAITRIPLRVGLVSDTHGLLRPEVRAFLEGSDLIVHGGDICDSDVLAALAAIAPVTAVRGNNDRGSWAAHLRETELLRVGEVFVYAIHDLAQLDIEPSGAGIHVVVSGHSHRPSVERRDGVLFVNPGSAGPRRFTLPISAGELVVTGNSVSARIVEFGGHTVG